MKNNIYYYLPALVLLIAGITMAFMFIKGWWFMCCLSVVMFIASELDDEHKQEKP
jgi:hypothetical protein